MAQVVYLVWALQCLGHQRPRVSQPTVCFCTAMGCLHTGLVMAMWGSATVRRSRTVVDLSPADVLTPGVVSVQSLSIRLMMMG